MKLIVDVPEVDYNYAKQQVADGITNPLKIFIASGTPIPDNATNGDVIKAVFPNGKYNEYFADVEMKTEENDTRFKSVFDRDWWDEPYQKGGTDEK